MHYALEESKTCVVVVILFFVFLAYALLDGVVFNTERYAEGPFYEVYLVGSLVFAGAAFALQRRADVPRTENLGVSILAGAAFGAALYVGLLRINELTDAEGLVKYEYRMTQLASFAPVQDGLPELRFSKHERKFWSSYELGQVETFELRKGGLDFYQIDMRPVRERMRNFYEQRRKSRKNLNPSSKP